MKIVFNFKNNFLAVQNERRPYVGSVNRDNEPLNNIKVDINKPSDITSSNSSKNFMPMSNTFISSPQIPNKNNQPVKNLINSVSLKESLYISTVKSEVSAEGERNCTSNDLLQPISPKNSVTDKRLAITKAFDNLSRAASCKSVS